MGKPRKRTIPCEKCPALFSKKEYAKRHCETAHSVPSDTQQQEVMEIADGAGKICKNCGEHYLKRHVTCLAVLSKTPPKKRSAVEDEDYDRMMSEFYANCQFKMKKPEVPESEPVSQQTDRPKRKIPNYFTCVKVTGTNCTYRTRIEAAFREHILTHVAEKLRDQLVS